MMSQQLSIALFGNTNNFGIILANAFLSLGHKVHVFVNRKEVLHRPESIYPEWLDNYPDWVHDCSALTDEDMAYRTPAFDRLVDQVVFWGADLAILNDTGPSLAGFLRTPHMVILTGSDLTYYADYDSLGVRFGSMDPVFRRSISGRRGLHCFADLVTRQRDGILSAEVVCYPMRGMIPEGDRVLDSIGIQEQNRRMFWFSDVNQLQPLKAPKNRPLRFFNPCRLVWKPSEVRGHSSQDYKGSDVLLKGFALYCRQNGDGELRMVRKGQDLAATEALAEELGIAHRLVWLDDMPLKACRNEMALADIVCDQLAQSLPGLVTMDAYALGRPVLANFRNELLAPYFGAPLPGLQANTPEEVGEAFLWADKNGAELAKLGMKGREYAQAKLSPEYMAEQMLSVCLVRKKNAARCDDIEPYW